jgi:cell pole-organizing protein PopZ
MGMPGQNATVEEILASIRQAISEDDARRTGERRPEPRIVSDRTASMAANDATPARYHQSPAAEPDAEYEAEVEIEEAVEIEGFAADREAEEADSDEDFLAAEGDGEIDDDIEEDAEAVADEAHDVIELAIEQAISGVRAELEGRRTAQSRLRPRPVEEAGIRMGPRPIPRAQRRATMVRREMPAPQPLRTGLLTPRTDEQVSASFDDLAKAMIEGNSHQLNTVVEDILRPMLKSWLDGNLPQIVERLVREEIERVSRGRR